MGATTSALIAATLKGEVHDVRVAVQNYPQTINHCEQENGFTALHIAAWFGYDMIMRELLLRHADPHIVDKSGRSALHIAAMKGHAEIVQALLRAGADAYLKDKTGRSSLDYAVAEKHSAAIMLLSNAPRIVPPPRQAAPPPSEQPQYKAGGKLNSSKHWFKQHTLLPWASERLPTAEGPAAMRESLDRTGLPLHNPIPAARGPDQAHYPPAVYPIPSVYASDPTRTLYPEPPAAIGQPVRGEQPYPDVYGNPNYSGDGEARAVEDVRTNLADSAPGVPPGGLAPWEHLAQRRHPTPPRTAAPPIPDPSMGPAPYPPGPGMAMGTSPHNMSHMNMAAQYGRRSPTPMQGGTPTSAGSAAASSAGPSAPLLTPQYPRNSPHQSPRTSGEAASPAVGLSYPSPQDGYPMAPAPATPFATSWPAGVPEQQWHDGAHDYGQGHRPGDYIHQAPSAPPHPSALPAESGSPLRVAVSTPAMAMPSRPPAAPTTPQYPPPRSPMAGAVPLRSVDEATDDDDWAPRPADDWGGVPVTGMTEPGPQTGPRLNTPPAPVPAPAQAAAAVARVQEQMAMLNMQAADNNLHPLSPSDRAGGLTPWTALPTAPVSSAPPATPLPHPDPSRPPAPPSVPNILVPAHGLPVFATEEAPEKQRSTDSGDSLGRSKSGRRYTYQELRAATANFAPSCKIGAGGYGPVYRGLLDGIDVAIKCMDTSEGAMQGLTEFQKEVNILSSIHHPHIVLLIGSCPERGMLVYELMKHGSLEDHLFGPSDKPAMPWQERLRITNELGAGLLFLHSNDPPIIHMDIKPGNVLLDRNMVSKLGDVGLARLVPESARQGMLSCVQDSRLVGTLAYMDPEYMRTGNFSPKSDVYSMGIVMLQLLTGRDNTGIVTAVEEAVQRAERELGPLSKLIDTRAGPWPPTEALAFAKLALPMVSYTRASRPDLKTDILPALRKLLQNASSYPAPSSPLTGSSPASGPSPTPAPMGGSNLPLPKWSVPQAPANPSPPTQSAIMPSMFMCPITQTPMEDPVFAADGYTYERSAIQHWLQQHDTSPMTNLKLEHKLLTPNHMLRSSIQEWVQHHRPQGAQGKW